MKRLLVTPQRCTGCRTCEIACAFSHPFEAAPGRSAIRAFLTSPPDVGMPVVCLQCDAAACVAVCPAGALWRSERSGAIVVDHGRCVRCRACVYACPFGNVAFDAAAARLVKCDLCGGEPRCAQFCPTRTLEYV